jgi:hypothetical protein
VYSTVRRPAARAIDAMKDAVEPLPFVPPTVTAQRDV